MGFLSYLFNLPDNQDEMMITAWQKLASSYHLRFIPPFPIMGWPQFVGEFRGHHLKLSASPKTRGSNDFRYTYAELTVNTSQMDNPSRKSEKHLGERLSIKDVKRMLIPGGLHYHMRGNIRVKADGKKICYKQPGLEYDVRYLQFILNLLGNLATGYPKVIALGGEAIPALQAIARDRDDVLQSVASQILEDIAYETENRLSHQIISLLCSFCLAHPGIRKVHVSWWNTITYYGCRVCGQSRVFSEKQAIVVLDSEMASNQSERDKSFLVNWFSQDSLFDFDQVQIIQATDEDVERFAVQVGNDTDPVRKPRYKQMPCTIAPDCHLSENTMRILRQTFGKVEVKATEVQTQ